MQTDIKNTKYCNTKLNLLAKLFKICEMLELFHCNNVILYKLRYIDVHNLIDSHCK